MKILGEAEEYNEHVNAIKDIVMSVLNNHPKDCEFIFDAANYIISEGLKAGDADSLLTILEDAFKECEIYCPHEGIDRRILCNQ